MAAAIQESDILLISEDLSRVVSAVSRSNSTKLRVATRGVGELLELQEEECWVAPRLHLQLQGEVLVLEAALIEHHDQMPISLRRETMSTVSCIWTKDIVTRGDPLAKPYLLILLLEFGSLEYR